MHRHNHLPSSQLQVFSEPGIEVRLLAQLKGYYLLASLESIVDLTENFGGHFPTRRGHVETSATTFPPRREHGEKLACCPGSTSPVGALVFIHSTLVAERGDKEFSVTLIFQSRLHQIYFPSDLEP